MILFLLAVSVIYFLFTLLLWLTWLRIPAVNPPQNGSAGPLVTVIIPVRNEADNIGALLTDLDRQTYRNFEVIVADDSSTDQTGAVVQQHIRQASFPLRLLALSDERTASPKKRAITQSIAIAQGHLILTTDGDCRVGPDWLSAFATFYQKTGLKLISGPVTFTTNQSVFDSLQTVEFSSLIGSGACTMALGWPTMCNGANLCYEKAAFAEVGGFAGVDQLASGDDEFLMHKMAVRYPGEVGFLKSEKAVVRTQPHRSWKAFYNQRKRWASKWRMYQSWAPTVLAVFIFLSNMAPLLAVVGWLLGFLNGTVTLSVVALKVLPEFLFLRQVLVFLQKKSSVAAIPLTQLFYPVYVVFFGLVAQGKGYRWKGRDLN
ncbi:glycosyltransferase [Spirosoma sp. RP8]|uniref:Glycosyltransferase n=1 Tax=Spirosoma liriopis TaxID=2937440 RepID=A0ABT0HNM8_9BACT|nr:glycosyltransferase [Spirosoma liriopis]MCK8493771.1 glycosyltransferase [Spirosoma liriopis]